MVDLERMADNPGVDSEKPKSLEQRVRDKVAETFHALLNESAETGKSLFRGIERTTEEGKVIKAISLIASSQSRLPNLRTLKGESLLSAMTRTEDLRFSVTNPNLPSDYNELEFYRIRFAPYRLDEAYTKEPPTKATPFGSKRSFGSDNDALKALEKVIDAFNVAGNS